MADKVPSTAYSVSVPRACQTAHPALGLPALRQALAKAPPLDVAGPHARHAAVAMILRQTADQAAPSLLLIERARHPRDPWSGHLAFPGGRVEDGDAHPRSAAMRETAEEVGVVLGEHEFVARVGTFPARPMSLAISVHAFALERTPTLELDPAEVADAFWVPLTHLLDPDRQVEAVPRGFDGARPAIRLFDPPKPVLWGLTYHFLEVLLHTVGHPLPPTGYQDLNRLREEAP